MEPRGLLAGSFLGGNYEFNNRSFFEYPFDNRGHCLFNFPSYQGNHLLFQGKAVEPDALLRGGGDALHPFGHGFRPDADGGNAGGFPFHLFCRGAGLYHCGDV